MEHARDLETLHSELPVRVSGCVDISADSTIVDDRALDAAAEEFMVTWFLHPAIAFETAVIAPMDEVLDASEADLTAWFSPTYGLRIPSRAARARRRRGQHGLKAVTTICAATLTVR